MTRQAARTYGHLPEADRADAVEAALRDLAARGVVDDGRAARTGVADLLTARLRDAHAAWCRLDAAAVPPPVAPTSPGTVADVVDRGLAGLERAVLQLELGAGRDTRTARAALRLRPRDYARHRREGLQKLRAAVDGQVRGHVCGDHAADVVLAATGDDEAQERLGAGAGRCRACSREAAGLRALLHERLALAPWPLTIAPLGALTAKLAGVGGAAAGAGSAATGAGGAAVATGGGFAGAGAVAATLTTVAALVGGGVLVADRSGSDERPARAAAATPAATATPTTVRASTAPAATATAVGRAAAPTRAAVRRARTRPTRTARPATVAPAPAPAATAAPAVTAAPASAPAARPTAAPVIPSAGDATRQVADAVEQVTAPVTGALPPVLADPVQETVQGVGGTVADVGAAVDGLLGR